MKITQKMEKRIRRNYDENFKAKRGGTSPISRNSKRTQELAQLCSDGAIVDWYSRFILSWELSNTLTTDFYLKALNETLKNGQKSEISNRTGGPDKSSQAAGAAVSLLLRTLQRY